MQLNLVEFPTNKQIIISIPDGINFLSLAILMAKTATSKSDMRKALSSAVVGAMKKEAPKQIKSKMPLVTPAMNDGLLFAFTKPIMPPRVEQNRM